MAQRIDVPGMGIVEFPDGMSDSDITAAIQKNAPKQDVGVAGDVAKSAGIGLVEGGIGVLGMGGDVRNLASKATDYVGQSLGVSQPSLDTFKGIVSLGSKAIPGVGGFLAGPTSQEIQGGIEQRTGEFYKPQTMAGEYAHTAGQFAPGLAVPGGQGSLLTRVATQVALPAFASETAGQLTKGTDFEPYARLAGGIGGGVLGSALTRSPLPKAPTADDLKSAATAKYNDPAVLGLELNKSSTAYAASRLADDLKGDGFRQLTAPQTFGLVDEINSSIGKTGKIADLQAVRTALNKVGGNFSNPTEQEAAKRAIAGIDDYLANLKPYDVAAGDGVAAANALKEAKGNYAAASRVSRVDDAEYRAELNAGSAHSGGNINNATRQALKSILISPSKRRGFSAEEIEQMEKVVKGGAMGNASRVISKVLATTGLAGAANIGTSIALAPSTYGASLAFPAIGYGAKKLADRSTANSIAKLDNITAMRSPLGAQMQASAPPMPKKLTAAQAGLLSALLSMQATSRPVNATGN